VLLNYFVYRLLFPMSVLENQNMKDEDILNQVEPKLKEYYSTFLLVGFKADDGEISCIGDMGCPKEKFNENLKLRPLHRQIARMIKRENEKNT